MLVVAMTYISEMMPSKNRGKYQALTIACGSLGLPLTSGLASLIVPMGAHTWRWMFTIGALGILLIPFGLKYLRESPRWLVSQGRIKEAEEIVSECTGMPCDLSSEALRMKNAEKGLSMWQAVKIMFDKRYLRTSSVIMLLAIGITVGNFFLANWTTVYMLDYGWDYQIGFVSCYGYRFWQSFRRSAGQQNIR